MLPAGGMRSFHLRRVAHGLIGIDESNHFASVARRASCGSLGARKKGSSFAVEIPLNLNAWQSRWEAAYQGQTAISGQSRGNRLMRLPISHYRFLRFAGVRRVGRRRLAAVTAKPKRTD